MVGMRNKKGGGFLSKVNW